MNDTEDRKDVNYNKFFNCDYSDISYFINWSNKYELLTKKEEKELSKIIIAKKDKKKVDEAVTKLVNCNLRLVLEVVKRTKTQYGNRFGDDKELIEYALCGLYDSAVIFDYRKAKFSSLAYNRMVWMISKTSKNEKQMIRLPQHHYEIYTKMNKHKESNLSNKKMAKKIGVTENMVKNVNDGIKQLNVTLYGDNEIFDYEHHQSEQSTIYEELKNRSLKEYMASLIDKLPEMYKNTIYQYYIKEEPITHICKMHNITSQGVSVRLKQGLLLLKKMMKYKEKINSPLTI